MLPTSHVKKVRSGYNTVKDTTCPTILARGIRRIRLCHNRLPISDFGVAKGSVAITIDRTIALRWEGQEKKI